MSALSTPVLRLSSQDLMRHGTKEVEGATVALHPRLLVALQHRPHEDAPDEREHRDEGRDDMTTSADRIGPHAHPAEVHLGNPARRRRGLRTLRLSDALCRSACARAAETSSTPPRDRAHRASAAHRGHGAVTHPLVELRDPLLLVANTAADTSVEQQPNAGGPLRARHSSAPRANGASAFLVIAETSEASRVGLARPQTLYGVKRVGLRRDDSRSPTQ